MVHPSISGPIKLTQSFVHIIRFLGQDLGCGSLENRSSLWCIGSLQSYQVLFILSIHVHYKELPWLAKFITMTFGQRLTFRSTSWPKSIIKVYNLNLTYDILILIDQHHWFGSRWRVFLICQFWGICINHLLENINPGSFWTLGHFSWFLYKHRMWGLAIDLIF